MAFDDPKSLTRKEFAEFLPTQRAIKAFEKLFELVPGEFNDLDSRVTANEINIAANTANIAINTANIAINTAAIAAINAILEYLDFTAYVVTANRTTTENELIVCQNTSAITITLNASPDDKEFVHIFREGASVTIEGNGNNILDNRTSATLSLAKGAAPKLIYISSVGAWYII